MIFYCRCHFPRFVMKKYPYAQTKALCNIILNKTVRFVRSPKTKKRRVMTEKLKIKIKRISCRMYEWDSLRIPNIRIPIPNITVAKKRMAVGPSAASENPIWTRRVAGIIKPPKPLRKAKKLLKIRTCFNSIVVLVIFISPLNTLTFQYYCTCNKSDDYTF